MALFDEKVSTQLKDILKNLGDKLTIAYYTQEFECGACRDTRVFVEEIASFSEKLNLEIYDFKADREKAEKLSIDKIPAIALLDSNKEDSGIRFFGLPGGYEINSFIEALLQVSGRKEQLSFDQNQKLAGIKKPARIQVFISLSCPYCPEAVGTANRIALECGLVRSEMVDIAVFPHLAQKYNVISVPKTIINETIEFTGSQPIEKLLDSLV